MVKAVTKDLKTDLEMNTLIPKAIAGLLYLEANIGGEIRSKGDAIENDIGRLDLVNTPQMLTTQ